MTPRVSDDHLESRRQQILDAAVRCFSRYGFHEATLERIRLEAELSRGAVYHYFRSKEEIVEAIRARNAQADQPYIEAYESAGNSTQQLDTVVRDALTRLVAPESRDASRVGLMLWAEALFNERLHAGQLRAMHEDVWPILDVVREAQAEGRINPALEAQDVTDFLLAAIIGIQVRFLWEPEMGAEGMGRVLLAALAGGFGNDGGDADRDAAGS